MKYQLKTPDDQPIHLSYMGIGQVGRIVDACRYGGAIVMRVNNNRLVALSNPHWVWTWPGPASMPKFMVRLFNPGDVLTFEFGDDDDA
jgi:hypothetical protein